VAFQPQHFHATLDQWNRMVIPLVVQGFAEFGGEFYLGGHSCYHTKLHENVNQKPQLAPVNSIYKRLHSCGNCREPLSLYDRLCGPCPRCGAVNLASPDITPDVARAMLAELKARRRELGLSDHP
jgi:hypothetical protein